jgi:hypothetical protein
MNSLVDLAWRVDAVLATGGNNGKSKGREPTIAGGGSAEAVDAAAANRNKVGAPLVDL